jgi:hypothetical protein
MSDEKKDENDENRKKRMFQMFRLISNFKEVPPTTGDEEKLGEPDKVQFTKTGEFYYKKSIWNTSMGQLIKIETMSHFTPEDFARANKPPKSKKEQIIEEIIEARELLEMAKEDQDYEYCAELRDRIVDLKEALLEEKNNPSETIENKGADDADGWNF